MSQIWETFYSINIALFFISLFCSTSLLSLTSSLLLVSSPFILKKEWKNFLHIPIIKPFIALCCVILLSILLAGPYEFRLKAFGKIRYMALYPILFLSFKKFPSLLKTIERIAIPLSIILGIAAILQFFGLWPSQRFLGLTTTKPIGEFNGAFYHAKGFVYIQIPFAFHCGMLFYMLLSLVFYSQEKVNRILKILCSTLVALALFLSFSRGGWLGFLGSIFIMSFFLGKNKRNLLLLFFSLTLLIAVSSSSGFRERLFSIVDMTRNRERIVLWKISTRMFLQSPLLGKGYHSFNDYNYKLRTEDEKKIEPYPIDPHSIYFEFLGGTGTIGFLTFIYFLFSTLKTYKTKISNSIYLSKEWALAVCGFSSFVFFMIAGLTDNHFFITYSLNTTIFFLAYWQYLLFENV